MKLMRKIKLSIYSNAMSESELFKAIMKENDNLKALLEERDYDIELDNQFSCEADDLRIKELKCEK